MPKIAHKSKNLCIASVAVCTTMKTYTHKNLGKLALRSDLNTDVEAKDATYLKLLISFYLKHL